MAKRQSSGAGEEEIELEGDTAYGDEDDQTPVLNSAARAAIIREAHQEIAEFEKQVAGLKAEIKAIVETRIVAGLGMKKADFALARKLYALDMDDRGALQDTIRECFSALGVGEQLNWLDAVETADA